MNQYENEDRRKSDRRIPPAFAEFLVAEHAAKSGPVKSLYVEIKREEVEGMRARIAELEQQRGECVAVDRELLLRIAIPATTSDKNDALAELRGILAQQEG